MDIHASIYHELRSELGRGVTAGASTLHSMVMIAS